MPAPSLPEVKDSNGNVLLPAAELVLQEPELTEVKKRLIEKGQLTPPEPRWVTPRTGQTYNPDTWREQKVHWHCYKTSGDPGGPGLNVPKWETGAPLDLAAKTPEEALAWLLECWETDLPRVPQEYREQGEYDQRTTDEGRWQQAELCLVRLSLGRTVTLMHTIEVRRQLRYHAEAQTPADCQRH